MTAMTASDMPSNFIYDAVTADVEQGQRGGRVQTRFPPEPNGFLHIGHGTVVDAGAYFREKEIQQGTGLHIAYGLVHVFAEIAFYGGNGLLLRVFGEFYAH